MGIKVLTRKRLRYNFGINSDGSLIDYGLTTDYQRTNNGMGLG